jgi:LysM repeat protein
LFALAQRFNTTVSAILALNPGLDPNALQVGRIICIPGAAPPTCPTGSVPYLIRSGDTLFLIAQRFGTTVSAILAINPGLDPNALRIGQTICIPQATPTCPGGTLYTIQPGDTLFLIATRFDVSVGALQTANPGLDPTRLVPGQRICIPAAPPITCPGNNIYVIQPGETLSSIAERFTVSAADILVLNPGLRPSDFVAGRTICIPTTQAPV